MSTGTTETETRRDLEREIDALRDQIANLQVELACLRNYLANERTELRKIAATINELSVFPIPGPV